MEEDAFAFSPIFRPGLMLPPVSTVRPGQEQEKSRRRWEQWEPRSSPLG